MPEPYRDVPTSPVCARCVHLHVPSRAAAQPPGEEHFTWLCEAATLAEHPAKYNPITGIEIKGYRTLKRCIEVNDKGQCTNFDAKPSPAPSPNPPSRPEDKPPPPPAPRPLESDEGPGASAVLMAALALGFGFLLLAMLCAALGWS